MQIETKFNIDSVRERGKVQTHIDYPLSRYILKHKNSSVWFSKYGQTGDFTTRDSKLYFNRNTLELLKKNKSSFCYQQRLDSVSWRVREKNLTYEISTSPDLYFEIKDRYSSARNYLEDYIRGSVQGVSAARMWNVSIVASVIFGMFLMTMVYRYLGQGAMAKERRIKPVESPAPLVLGAGDSKNSPGVDVVAELLRKQEEEKKSRWEDEIRQMVKGYPIEDMVPYIAKKDKVVAAFLVGIAKKESNWGKRVPVLDGEDCYNYWGYRGKRARMGTGGHTCFDSRQDAVDTVAKRLEFLVSNEKVNTPGKMVTVWKCGYDCSWDDPKNVRKWVSDVEMYFDKFNKEKSE